MSWRFGIRKDREDGSFYITEEFRKMFGYAEVGRLDAGYTQKEIINICTDIIHQLNKGRMKRA